MERGKRRETAILAVAAVTLVLVPMRDVHIYLVWASRDHVRITTGPKSH